MSRRSLSDHLFTLANEAKGVATDEHGRLHFLHYTRKEIAARLGVSDRTLRRWMNEGVPPSSKHAATIASEGAKAARRIKRKGGASIGGLSIPAHRRELIEWEYRGGRAVDTGKRTLSDWRNYDVARLTLEQIVSVAAYLRDTVGYIQFIYEIHHGDDNVRGGRSYHNGAHASTYGEDVRDMTDEELRVWIESLLWRYMALHGYDEDDDDELIAARMAGYRPNRILYIGANPNALPPGERLS